MKYFFIILFCFDVLIISAWNYIFTTTTAAAAASATIYVYNPYFMYKCWNRWYLIIIIITFNIYLLELITLFASENILYL